MNKNKHYKKVIVLVAIITLFAGASAFAEDGNNNHPGGPMGWFRGLFGGNQQHVQNGDQGENASSTFNGPRGMMGSSTRPFPQGMRGEMMGRGRDNASSTFRGEGRGIMGSSTRPILSGLPVVGTVVSVNGTSFTITNRGNKTFTVDASNAKITTRGATPTSTPTTITVSNLTIGENVLVIGQVSTTTSSIVAKQVIAGIAGPRGEEENASSTEMNNGLHAGLLQKIGNFFGHMFGR